MPQLHSSSLNLYEMFMDVRRNLSEVTAAFWTDLEVYNKLNQGQVHIVTKSKCLKKTVTITTTTGTQEYDLRTSTNSFSDIIDIAEDGVYFKISGTTYFPLKYRSIKRLNIEFPGWQGTPASNPTYYYYNKSTKTIGLYPKPNASNAGAYLFVTGYHKPKILHAGTAAAGLATSITLQAGSATAAYPSVTDDYYNNLYIEIYSGTGAGQKAKITDYTGSTRVCLGTFATAPSTDSIYGIVPEIPEEAHYLMPLYALWKLWPKGGSRTTLGATCRQEYYGGLSEFIGEFIENDDEEIIKDSYR
jgi:hypothetical protein